MKLYSVTLFGDMYYESERKSGGKTISALTMDVKHLEEVLKKMKERKRLHQFPLKEIELTIHITANLKQGSDCPWANYIQLLLDCGVIKSKDQIENHIYQRWVGYEDESTIEINIYDTDSSGIAIAIEEYLEEGL